MIPSRIRHRSRGIETLLLVLPLVAVLFLYAQVRNHGYVDFDDMYYTYENPVVLKGLTWEGFQWAFSGSHVANYHPLTWLSHMLDFELWGNQPGYSALTNAVIHGVNAILLSLLIRQLFRSSIAGLAAGLVFAVHPQLVEAVAWISQRKTVLSTVFALGTLNFYLVARARRSDGQWIGPYGAALVAFVASLLAKGMYVTMPAVLVLVECLAWLQDRQTRSESQSLRWRDFIASRTTLIRVVVWTLPFAAMAGVMSLVTIWAQAEGNAVHSLASTPLALRLATAFEGICGYVSDFIYPTNLAVFYPRQETFDMATFLASSAVLIAVTTAAGALLVRRGNVALLGWMIFLTMLLPVAGLVQVGEQGSADRYMYGPVFGLLIAGVAVVRWIMALSQKATIHRAIVACLAVWIALASAACWRQVAVWHDSYTLAIASERNVGPVPQVLAIKATILNRARHYEEAAAACRLGLEQAPTHISLLQNLATAEFGQGRTDQAIAILESAAPLAPDITGIPVNLAYFYLSAGKIDQALATIDAALATQPATTSEIQLLQSLRNEAKKRREGGAPSLQRE